MRTEAVQREVDDRATARGPPSTCARPGWRCRRSPSSPTPSSSRPPFERRSRALGPTTRTLNLFRVHWHNAADRVSHVDVPEHLVLPRELTGVDARIVVALGDRFLLIGAHKVLAAYGCLARVS